MRRPQPPWATVHTNWYAPITHGSPDCGQNHRALRALFGQLDGYFIFRRSRRRTRLTGSRTLPKRRRTRSQGRQRLKATSAAAERHTKMASARPRKNEVVKALAGTTPTLIVACFYPKLIPRSVLDLAPGINVHPSPLPRWRGPDPCTWSIRRAMNIPRPAYTGSPKASMRAIC